jgi:hypothetical protein
MKAARYLLLVAVAGCCTTTGGEEEVSIRVAGMVRAEGLT